jgi:hypothetical protein
MIILNNIFRFLTFWKTNPKTNIPRELHTKTQSLHHYEKAAALKVVKFAKRHFIEQEDLNELFEAELEYEQKKYQARHDFPHQAAIRKSDIATAKKAKYERIKEGMSAEAYRKYLSYRARQRKKYPQKD